MRLGVTATLAATIALAGCAQQIVQQKEDTLVAAGFHVQTADTPQRIASIQALPPHRFVHESLNGHEVWVYSDPTVCRCLYVGGPDAYQRYQQLQIQQNIANQQVEAAQLNSMGWGVGPYGWGAWGPWGY
jgi:hypothetical protein